MDKRVAALYPQKISSSHPVRHSKALQRSDTRADVPESDKNVAMRRFGAFKCDKMALLSRFAQLIHSIKYFIFN